MPYPRPGAPPNVIPPSSTATTTAQQQKGPVIGPQVPNTKPLFPAAQVRICYFSLTGIAFSYPINSKYLFDIVVYSSTTSKANCAHIVC